MKTRFGIFLVIIGIINIIKGTESIDSMIKSIPLIIIFVGAGFWMIYSANKKKTEEEKVNQQKQLYKQKRNQEINEITNVKLNNVDKLIEQLAEVNKLNIPNIDEFKDTIIKNEIKIIEKGGDSQLFSFLKIDSFLKDFRIRIIEDQKGLTNLLDENWLKSRIKEESKRDDLEKIADKLESSLAKLENRKAKDFDSNVDSLFSLGDKMKPIVINQIKTMEFYENMSLAMIVFYLEDKKIRYFEIHEAFEKLGVFDSTWEKNVLNKLDRIEIRLAQISNQLTELNQHFISLVESSDNIVSELKEINSSIMTNNMLQAITAYQTWRVNKNTKILND